MSINPGKPEKAVAESYAGLESEVDIKCLRCAFAARSLIYPLQLNLPQLSAEVWLRNILAPSEAKAEFVSEVRVHPIQKRYIKIELVSYI